MKVIDASKVIFTIQFGQASVPVYDDEGLAWLAFESGPTDFAGEVAKAVTESLAIQPGTIQNWWAFSKVFRVCQALGKEKTAKITERLLKCLDLSEVVKLLGETW